MLPVSLPACVRRIPAACGLILFPISRSLTGKVRWMVENQPMRTTALALRSNEIVAALVCESVLRILVAGTMAASGGGGKYEDYAGGSSRSKVNFR